MKKLYDKQKPILLTLLIIVTFTLIIFTSISLYKNLKNENDLISGNNKIYGTVLENGNNYIKLKDLDGNTFMIRSKDSLEVGDFVVAYFDDDDKDFSGKSRIEIIARENEIVIDEVNTEISTNKTEIVTTPTSHETITSSNTKGKTSKKTTTRKVISSTNPIVDDDEIVNYFSSEYNEVSSYSSDQTLKERTKEKFITFVDFIFYDGEIKGKKFSELTASAKTKVIYYTLLLDSKIDAKWPDYKKNIGDKYHDIKAKLVAKYMEITTSICENNKENCENVKNDFALLKKSVGLTWDVIKGAFSYAYNSGKEQLVKWYEVFSGKV